MTQSFVIEYMENASNLQADLDTLVSLETAWLIRFSVDKYRELKDPKIARQGKSYGGCIV